MSALDQIAAARDATFSARVAMLALRSAVFVGNEDPATEDHAARLAWANAVLRAELNNKHFAAAVIASNPTISAAIDADPGARGSNVPDGDIEFVINSILAAFGRALLAGGA